MSSKFRNITAFALLSVAVLIYRFAMLEVYFGWSSSTAQFALLPIVFFALTLVSFWQERVPRYALILAVIASSCLGIASFGLKIDDREDLKVYISPFMADASESQTIRFSDLITKNFDSINLDLVPERISNPLTTPKQAQEFFKKNIKENNQSDALAISGTTRWIALSVSPGLGESIISKQLLDFTSALGLGLATKVSGTGLSDAFSSASQNFISRLVAAFADLNNGDVANAEIHIADAAGIIGKWSSTAHRAYALWLLGTLYLGKAFSDDSFEPAYLRCSIQYFTRARGFIRNNDTPELLAAVLNNRAVAHFLGYMFLGQKEMRKQALREFKLASKLASKKSSVMDTPAWLVAKMNWRYFNQPKDLKRQYARKVNNKIRREKKK